MQLLQIQHLELPYQGTFTYTPPSGTVLSVGTHTLSTTFTPTNTANYTTASANVSINVIQATFLAYVTGGVGLDVINTATNKIISTLNVGQFPWGVAVNPDGTKVYVANSGSNNISVINTATNKITA